MIVMYQIKETRKLAQTQHDESRRLARLQHTMAYMGEAERSTRRVLKDRVRDVLSPIFDIYDMERQGSMSNEQVLYIHNNKEPREAVWDYLNYFETMALASNMGALEVEMLARWNSTQFRRILRAWWPLIVETRGGQLGKSYLELQRFAKRLDELAPENERMLAHVPTPSPIEHDGTSHRFWGERKVLARWLGLEDCAQGILPSTDAEEPRTM